MDGDMEQETWHVYNFGKRNVFRLDLNESREGFFLLERKGKVTPCWWTEHRKGAGTNSLV